MGKCFSCDALTQGYLVSGCENSHISHFVICGGCMPDHMYPRCLTRDCSSPPADWIWLGEDGRKVASWS